jgi:hypothetical protein
LRRAKGWFIFRPPYGCSEGIVETRPGRCAGRCPKGSPKGIKWPCHGCRDEALVRLAARSATRLYFLNAGGEGAVVYFSETPMKQNKSKASTWILGCEEFTAPGRRVVVVEWRTRLVDERASSRVAPSFNSAQAVRFSSGLGPTPQERSKLWRLCALPPTPQ